MFLARNSTLRPLLSNCQIPLPMGTYVPIGWSHSAFSLQDLLHSLRLLQSGQFLAWPESCSKQCLGWRPTAQLPTHHLFLGHCCYCPTAQLMALRPSAACTFALLKIVRKSCAVPVSDRETMLLQQMRIPPPPLESCIAASTATGLPSLPCFSY